MRNILWSLTNTFLNRGFSTVFLILLGNLLLPGELGIYISVMLVVAYASSLLSLQIGAGVVQKLNDQKLKALRSHYFLAGWLTTTVISVVAVSLLYLGQDFLLTIFNLQGQQSLLLFSLPLIFLMMSREYFNRVLQADLELKSQTLINVFATITQIIVALLLILAGYGLYGILVGLYLGNLTAIVGMVYIAIKRYGLIFDRTIFNVAKDLMRFGSLIYLGFIAVFLDKNIDIFFVNFFLAKDQLAIYNYASRLALLILIFGNSLSVVTFPKLTRAFSGVSKETDRIYSLSLSFSFLIVSNLSLVLIFHIEYLIALILPPIYLATVSPLTILLVGLVLFSAFASVGAIFTAKGIPGTGAFAVWLALGVNVLLCLMLIPRYGIIGAAFATSTSFVARVIIGMILVEYKIKTGYNYFGLVFSYSVLIGLVFLGSFVLSTLVWKELLIVGYMALSIPLLLRKYELAYLKELLGGLQKRGILGRTSNNSSFCH